MALQLAEDLLREVLGTLRTCGDGARECVCWLTGPIDRPGVVDEFLHPPHSASAVGYWVADSWINETWVGLARRAREVRLQVHTHPGAAYHSSIDDDYPAVQTAGFLSLVIPRFALGADGLAGAHLAEITDTGNWQTVDPAERLVVG